MQKDRHPGWVRETEPRASSPQHDDTSRPAGADVVSAGWRVCTQGALVGGTLGVLCGTPTPPLRYIPPPPARSCHLLPVPATFCPSLPVFARQVSSLPVRCRLCPSGVS